MAAAVYFPMCALSAPELGLALFHERGAALGIVLAFEAVEDEAAAGLGVAVGVELEHLAEDGLPHVLRHLLESEGPEPLQVGAPAAGAIARVTEADSSRAVNAKSDTPLGPASG